MNLPVATPAGENPFAGDSTPAKSPPSQGRESAGLIIFFCVVLITHFCLATFNWHSGFLVEHEFRQTHTAIITYYLDKENRFSLHYTTPLFGKPWSVPMEFPLYEWSVVLLSRAAHWPHFEAARAVSLTCFYLTLPAVWLLLGYAGLAAPRRLLALALTLACPVYIFYSRTFLMESMVLMFSVWFLAMFVRTMQERRFLWLVLCAISGAGSGLIKSTTFFVWLLPAGIFGGYCLWRDLRRPAGWKAVLKTVGWGLGAASVPCIAVLWWVKYTDAIKVPHPSAHIFTSSELTRGSFGLYSVAARFSPEIWRALMRDWRLAIMSPWIIGLLVLAGVAFFRRDRWRILAATGLFLAAQLLFPFAYAYQDYYFYACVVYLLVALGYVLHAVLDSGLPQWMRWVIVLVPIIAMWSSYLRGYYLAQRVRSNGGSGLADAICTLTPKDSVIIVAGADWAPMIPYYSERKALMIRHGLEHDPAYLTRAFNDLADENVSTLVMAYDERRDETLVRRAAQMFNLDTFPTFSCPFADVYLNRFYHEPVVKYLTTNGRNTFNQVTTEAEPAPTLPKDSPPSQLTPGIAASAFTMVSPLPSAYRFTFGYSTFKVDGVEVLSVHPDCDLWVPPPAGATQILWEFGIVPGAYDRPGAKTNGVEFVVEGEVSDGSRREIFRRLLDPATVPADRGHQRAVIPYRAVPGEKLVFFTRPNRDYFCDWAYWIRIVVK
jgi:hypothetical protein